MTSSALVPNGLSVPDDVNRLHRGVWPATAERLADGQLALGGIPATEIASMVGTPVLVLDEADARRRAARTLKAFTNAASAHGTTARVYYAGKALLTSDVARWMLDEGLRIDVCSGGELALALAAGVPSGQIGFHGNNKRVWELERAVAAGVGTIILDSEIEVERLSAIAERLGREQDVLIRVNSGVHAETHDFLATAHEDQKFGFTLAQAPLVAERIAELPRLNLFGVHCHIGSQIFGASGFRESAARLIDLVEALASTAPVSLLNLGGGFGIAYTEADDPEPIHELAAEIVQAVADECAVRGLDIPELAFEPGRSIIGPAGVTLYEVGTVKTVTVGAGGERERRYVSVDGGMSDNPRHVLYGAQYAASLVSRQSDEPPVLSRIVGLHCEAGDIVVDQEYLPSDVAPGDLVAVPATGAYTAPLSSTYNLTPRPPVIAVKDGALQVLVRRETIDDVLARDEGLPQRVGKKHEGES